MNLYLASGKDQTADSGQWVIIVEANSRASARFRVRQRLSLSQHQHLADSYHFQELPVGINGLLYCDCTGASQ